MRSPLCVQGRAYVHVSKNLEEAGALKLRQGCFSTELSPLRQQSHYTQQPGTDWLHSAAVLEIEFFLSPTGTNHIAFTLFIPLFCHTRSPARREKKNQKKTRGTRAAAPPLQREHLGVRSVKDLQSLALRIRAV